MVYIQVYIVDKGEFIDFRTSKGISILNLKSLILECIYNIKYDDEFIKDNYLLIDYVSKNKLGDMKTLFDYGIYDGYRLLLV